MPEYRDVLRLKVQAATRPEEAHVWDLDTGQEIGQRIPVHYWGAFKAARPGEFVEFEMYCQDEKGQKYIDRKRLCAATEQATGLVKEVI